MKKLLIPVAIATCFALSSAQAQTVNGVRLSEIRSDYVQVRGDRRPFTTKFLILLEYGQNIYKDDNSYVKDDNGKKMEFESTLDFVNKMKGYNYELFQVFTEQTGKESNIPVYILKRK